MVNKNVQSADGVAEMPVDSTGASIDSENKKIGWPERAGNLEIMNGQRLVVKTWLIEVLIPSQAAPVSQYNFKDQPALRNVAVWGLEAYTTSICPISPLSGTALITDAMIGYFFLWMQLYSNSYNFMQNHPWVKFKTINSNIAAGGAPFNPQNIEGLIGQHINWPNCYFNVAAPTTAIEANTAYSIMLDVYYSFYNNWQVDGLGGSFGLR